MKFNRKLLAALMVVCLLVTAILPASAAELNASYSPATYYNIATSTYSRMLQFQDGVVPAADQSQLFGLVDLAGNVAVPFQYTNIYTLGNGMFRVEDAQRNVGIIDATGEYLYPMTARDVSKVGQYLVIYDGQYEAKCYDMDLNPLDLDPDKVGFPSALTAYDSYWQTGSYYRVYLDDKCGLVDGNFKVVLQPEYDYISVGSAGGSDYYLVTKDGQAALFDSSAKEVIPFGTYDNITFDLRGSETLKVSKDGQLGVVDFANQVLVPLGDYDMVGGLNTQGYISAIANAYDMDAVVSTIFKDGKEVKSFPGKQVSAEAYYRDFAFSTDGEHSGIMDLDEKVIIPAQYYTVDPSGYGSALLAITEDTETWDYTYSLLQQDGSRVLADDYASLSYLGDEQFLVSNDGLYGILSSGGKEVIPMKYQDLRIYNDHFVAVYDGSRYAVIDRNNQSVLPSTGEPYNIFDRANSFNSLTDLGIGMCTGDMEYYDGFTGTVLPFRVGDRTVYADYTTGTVQAETPYVTSAINSDGVFVYVDENGLYGFAQTTAADAPWAGITGSVPSQPEQPAKDEPSGWAKELVDSALEAGIVPEALQSKYTQSTTRGEFCALAVQLYETVTGQTIEDRVTFTDTQDVNVEKAAAIGVISGVSEGIANPNGNINREQAAIMLAKLAEVCGKALEESEPTFADSASVSKWAAAAVGQVQAAGVMSGTGDNNFSPKGNYSRQQSIITMLSVYNLVK